MRLELLYITEAWSDYLGGLDGETNSSKSLKRALTNLDKGNISNKSDIEGLKKKLHSSGQAEWGKPAPVDANTLNKKIIKALQDTRDHILKNFKLIISATTDNKPSNKPYCLLRLEDAPILLVSIPYNYSKTNNRIDIIATSLATAHINIVVYWTEEGAADDDFSFSSHAPNLTSLVIDGMCKNIKRYLKS